MQDRIGVFIDTGNLFFCINKKWPGRKLDYAEYLEKVDTMGCVVRRMAYGTQVDGVAAKFITALQHAGYETNFVDVVKNNWYSWALGISMDIVRLVVGNKIDILVLGCSDKTMLPLINWVKEQGIVVHTVSCGISKELKDASSSWTELTENELGPENDITEATE
jgi:uncharacterized LabA/DUF88 family protein